MPLTLAHPAAVLPLRRAGVPMSALVLGSMVPDVPLFLGLREGYRTAHSWAGVVTVDVVAVMLGLVLWFGFVRDALVDLAPRIIRLRLPGHAGLDVRHWCLAPVAAAIGAASHVAWDAFTHIDGAGTTRFAWLRETHAGLVGYQWGQYLSGIVGAAVVAAYVGVHVSRRPVLREQAMPRALGTWTLPAVAGTALVVGVVVALSRIRDGLHVMAYDSVVSTISTAVGLTLITAAIWRLRVRRSSPVRD